MFDRDHITRRSWLDRGKLPKKLRETSFEDLWNLHPETRPKVLMGGKLVETPRWQVSFLRDYKFAGVVSKATELPDPFVPYLDWINEQGYGEFNQMVVNWYEDGRSYIGPHADNTQPLVPQSPIASITLASEGIHRTFRIRDHQKKIVADFPTPNGVVLVMGGFFQEELKHEIVKITGKKASLAGKRISLTFRQFSK